MNSAPSASIASAIQHQHHPLYNSISDHIDRGPVDGTPNPGSDSVACVLGSLPPAAAAAEPREHGTRPQVEIGDHQMVDPLSTPAASTVGVQTLERRSIHCLERNIGDSMLTADGSSVDFLDHAPWGVQVGAEIRAAVLTNGWVTGISADGETAELDFGQSEIIINRSSLRLRSFKPTGVSVVCVCVSVSV